jgi:hypothetical protein
VDDWAMWQRDMEHYQTDKEQFSEEEDARQSLRRRLFNSTYKSYRYLKLNELHKFQR